MASSLLSWAFSLVASQTARAAAATPARRCDACARSDDDDAATPPPPPAPPTTTTTTLALPGYGILFFHQLGMLAHLRERGLFFNKQPQATEIVGSSAGALAAVLVACDVCPSRAVRAAHALCERAGLYSPHLLARLLRPCALMGRWGKLVREWLEELLPEDAHLRAERARCRVAVTRVRPLGLSTELLSSFASRAELIEALAASAHVPLFMDGKLWATTTTTATESENDDDAGDAPCPLRRHQKRRLVDGSFLHLLLGEERGGLVPPADPCAVCSTPQRRVVVLDPFRDDQLRWGWLRCLSLPSLEGALALAARGKAHAAELERRGVFDGLLMEVEGKGKMEVQESITVLAGAGGSSASLASEASAVVALSD